MIAVALAVWFAAAAGPHDPEHRLAELDARIARAPHDVELRVQRARVQLVLGDLHAARADVDFALRVAPDHVGALLASAGIAARSGDDVALLQASRRAEALGVHDRGLVRGRGRALLHLGRPAEAAAAFTEALAAEAHTSPEHWLELAAAHTAAQQHGAAREALARGLRALGPAVALVDAAVALDVQQGRFAEALTCLEQLRPFVRQRAWLQERRARVFAAAGLVEAAEAERQLALVPGEGCDERERAAGLALPLAAVAHVNRAASTSPASPASPPTPVTLVPFGSVWRYADQGVLPAANWFAPAFSDTSWASGPGQLGYGDGDEATVVQSGPTGAVYPTTWFRHTFTLAGPVPPTAQLRLLIDDGAVVYVNGVEVARWNLPAGPVLPTTWAVSAVSGAAENAVHTFAFAPTLLVPGSNVIAVEIHQSAATSSDVSFDAELVGDVGAITVLRGPYLQDGTPGAATVCWRTDVPTATKLWLGPTAANLQPAYFDPTPAVDHQATVTGLAAETTYAYAIGDAAGVFPSVPAASLRTLPPVGAVRPLRTWVLGDAGTGTAAQLAVRDAFATWAGNHPADAILLLGDNAYTTGTDIDYQVAVFDVYGPWLANTFTWSTLGNHDAASVITSAQVGPYYDVFALPKNGEAGGLPSGTEAYYSFDRGHVHFVCLDSMDSSRAATGAMMTWLQADLANTNARWLIAFFHHPPYSKGSHDSDDLLDSGGRMTDMRQVALPLLEAAGVDLVLCGHSHSYERSLLVDGHYGVSTSLQPAMVRDRGDGRVTGDGFYGKRSTGLAAHEGAVYVVSGSAGGIGGGTFNHRAMRVNLDHLGSFVFDVDGDRLEATFVGLAGVEDEFTLVKGDPRTFFRDQPTLAVGTGGRQDWRLVAGPALANKFYVIAGSFGTTPGVSLGGLHVPLNPDAWMQTSLALLNTPAFPNSFGLLDAQGGAVAALVLPPLGNPSLVGTSLYHAYVVGDGTSFLHASNAVKITFAP